MFFGSLVLIGLSLAMDASAIAISNGIVYEGGAKQSVITALTFGLAQAIMPVLGYLAGTGLADIISSIDHWLAFILLAGIGGKMLYEGIRELKSEELPKGDKKLPVKTLIMQAIATSIDALVIGRQLCCLRRQYYPGFLNHRYRHLYLLYDLLCLGQPFRTLYPQICHYFWWHPADYHRHQDTYRASGRLSASQPSTCITKSTDKQQIR